jgi:hypothetical protein
MACAVTTNAELAMGESPAVRNVERRDWWRWAVRAFLGVRRDTDAKPVFGRAHDISENGMGAVIPVSLDTGDKVTLEFALHPSGPSITVNAVVRHGRCFHYGFEFVGLSEAESEAIRSACTEEVALSAVHIEKPA